MAKFRTGDIPQFKDVNDVASYLYQMQEQLGYILNHLETDNLTEDALNTLTAQKTLADLNGMPADTKINGLDGVLNVSSGGTGRNTLTENQLLYGAGAEAPASLGFPSVAGSVLSQDIIGAPYWGPPNYNRCFAEVLIGSTQTVATTARTKLKFNSLNYSHDPYGLFTVNSTGIKVNQSGLYSLYYYVDLGAVAGTGSGGLLWIGTNDDQERYHRRLDGGNNADYADTKLMYLAAGEYVYIGIQQGAATSNKYGAARSQAQIVLRPIKID